LIKVFSLAEEVPRIFAEPFESLVVTCGESGPILTEEAVDAPPQVDLLLRDVTHVFHIAQHHIVVAFEAHRLQALQRFFDLVRDECELLLEKGRGLLGDMPSHRDRLNGDDKAWSICTRLAWWFNCSGVKLLRSRTLDMIARSRPRNIACLR
jgi:hypothetical protein